MPDVLQEIEKSISKNLNWIQSHRTRKSNNDHSNIDAFQNSLTDDLNSKFPNSWKAEYQPSKDHKDSIDIFGEVGKETWIIEIDALRTDQVTQKFVSRIALLGQMKPMNYVAILYPFSKSNKNGCIKYLKYIHDILNLINEDSKVFGVIIEQKDKQKSDLIINSINFKKGKQVRFVINNKISVTGMVDCAKEAIKLILSKKKYATFADAEADLAPYIKDKEGGSREIAVGMKTRDGKDVYCCSQWRYFGSNRNWGDFVSKCKSHGVNIKEDW